MDLEQLNQFGAAHLPGLIGIEFVAIDAGELEAELQVRDELLAPNGYLHAASVVALADTCCGYGTVASLPHGANGFTTIELKTNFVGTATSGRIRCVAKLLHGGRTTQLWRAEVTRVEDDRSIAHFSCTQMVLYPEG
ncbi:MAG: PaaI family thioesterase [Acidimicrobiia bacterium]|nr:PaaI family thioesterase [Acidimicrobiia bacterium]